MERMIQTAKQVIPTIYAYTTPGYIPHDGWTKIGDTKRGAETRIDEQTFTADIDYKLEWELTAKYEASDETFRDHDFHAYMQKKGIERKRRQNANGQMVDLEWFKIAPADAKMMLYDFRADRGIIKALGAVPYSLRDEQMEAVQQTKDYFLSHDGKGPEFLWNAKPRFGKTLQVDLTTPIKRLERGSMTVKELEKIDNLDELLGYAEQIIDKTPIDNAFQASVRKLLQLTLNVVLGYEIYALSFERKQLERKNKENPDQAVPYITTYDWNDVAEDLILLMNDGDVFPLPRIENMHMINDGTDLFLEKIRYMLHSVGYELFEDFDEDGYRDGYIQQVGRVAEADAHDLISFLKNQDNVIITSFKLSLLQMIEIVESLSPQ